MTRRNRRPIQLCESTTTAPAPLAIAEASDTLGALTPVAGNGRRYLARLIQGDIWGSSGYYPRAVLERDGPTVFPVGTLGYLNHPSESEEYDRPERSVRDMAMRIASTPTYQGDGLYAEVEVFAHMAPIVDGLAEAAGLSIRAAGLAETGEMGGRTGPVITALTDGYSVDLVTRAGAGGKFVRLLESGRPTALREARTVGAWLESRLHLALTTYADEMYGDGRLTRAERITLSGAIGDGLAAWTARVEADAPDLFNRDLYDEPPAPGGAMAAVEAAQPLTETTSSELSRALDAALDAAYVTKLGNYVWVCDYDPDLLVVWFTARDADGEHTWQQSYQLGDNDVLTLTGARTQVIARTEYEPVGPGGETEVEDPQDPDEATEPDETPVAESAPTGATTQIVQDGAPPTLPAPPTTERSETVSDTALTTGPAPGTAGTAAVASVATPVAEAAAVDTRIMDRLAAVEAALAASTATAAATLRENQQLRADNTARDSVVRLLGESSIPDGMRALIEARVSDQVIGRVALTEAGTVDQPALDTAIGAAILRESSHAARLLEAQGVGAVRGLGDTSGGELTPAARNTQRAATFASLGLSESASKVAARGSIGVTV